MAGRRNISWRMGEGEEDDVTIYTYKCIERRVGVGVCQKQRMNECP